MDKDITSSTREGVYVVFLLSSDYKHVYLTLNQGTTVPGQFGPRLKKNDILTRAQSIRNLLHENSDILKQDGNADISDERYKVGAIYYTLWDIENSDKGYNLLKQYLNIYKQYKTLKFNNEVTMTGSSKKEISCNVKYRPYITAIKSKPFLLLAGISGTGKSRIVRGRAGMRIRKNLNPKSRRILRWFRSNRIGMTQAN